MAKELNNQNWGIQLKNCTKDDLKNNLPINEDYHKMTVKQEIIDLHIQSQRDYFEYVSYCAKQYKEVKTLLANGKTPKFKDTDIYDLLI